MSSGDKLKELLHYSTSLSSSSTVPPTQDDSTTTQKHDDDGPRQKLDASMLDAIMGPDDAELMKRCMWAIESRPPLPRDEIAVAFENLEALVEQIDNAKNLRNLGLWAPLVRQLFKKDGDGGDGEVFRVGGCAVIATAVQNNPVSQDDFLALTLDLPSHHDSSTGKDGDEEEDEKTAGGGKEGGRGGGGGLAVLVDLFMRDPSLAVRRKALFATTCTLRNNPAAQRTFDRVGGWRALSRLLSRATLSASSSSSSSNQAEMGKEGTKEVGTEKVDLNMLRRIVFFLGTLYTLPDDTSEESGKSEDSSVSDEIKSRFPPLLVSLLATARVQADEDTSEKILYTLLAALKSHRDVLTREERRRLRTLAAQVGETYGKDVFEFAELDAIL